MTNNSNNAASIRTLLDSTPEHPSGFSPVAVLRAPDGEALLLVYYHDDQMLTQEVRYD